MQHQFLEVLQKRASGPVHHALGHSGCARGEQHDQRMIERQLGEIEIAGSAGKEILEENGLGQRVQ